MNDQFYFHLREATVDGTTYRVLSFEKAKEVGIIEAKPSSLRLGFLSDMSIINNSEKISRRSGKGPMLGSSFFPKDGEEEKSVDVMSSLKPTIVSPKTLVSEIVLEKKTDSGRGKQLLLLTTKLEMITRFFF